MSDSTPKMSVTTCPRRMEELGAWEYKEGLDRWESRGAALCCSFCGSLNPYQFIELAENGVNLGPTDKNYKVYVTLNEENSTRRDYKFYFQHLSKEQQLKFIELCNMRPRPFTIEYPGRFYVLPFFIEVAPSATKEVNDD